MKREEKIAKSYLELNGFKNIIFEPNGNRTPDFSIDNKIGVEVRRLNQFHQNTPLEKTYFKVIPRIENLLKKVSNKDFEKSAFVSIKFSRPLKINKSIIEKVIKTLTNHINVIDTYKKYEITDNLEIDIIPSNEKLEYIYNFGSSLDLNEGGFVLSNIKNSLKLIISEKSDKVAKHKSDYKEWWLILIDYVGYGLSQKEIKDLKESLDFNLFFDKIIIVPPLNPKEGKTL